jgi:hypothetical protein
MNRLASLLDPRVWLIGLMLLLPACATTDRSAEVAGTLKVHVNVPPSWNLLLDDRISEAFVDRVRDVFYRSGFDRPVEQVRSVEDPGKQPYLLTINLAEWRINRVGNIDCTFTAELKTPRGTKNLGVYTNTSMRWLEGVGRWGLARSFGDAAEGAIGDLCEAVAKSELLPGLRRDEFYSSTRDREPRSS